jgi:hypothetical protein
MTMRDKPLSPIKIGDPNESTVMEPDRSCSNHQFVERITKSKADCFFHYYRNLGLTLNLKMESVSLIKAP